MTRWWRKVFSGRKRETTPAELNREASLHYQRGNHFFDSKAWGAALKEWRRATEIWRLASGPGRRMAARLIHLRTVLVFLATMMLVYTLIFTFFPRSRWEMILMAGGAQDNRAWWERFLDNGRPQPPGGGHKLGVREWWEGFKQRLRGQKRREIARQRGGRPKIDERWEKLLRRYGRYGPFFNSDLDVNIISGYGLSGLGDYKNSVKVFEKGVEKTTAPEKLADLYQGLANAHYYKGYVHQKDGLAKYDMELVQKSLKAYERALAFQPRPISYGNLGWMYFLVKDYEKASEYSRRALSMNPGLEYVQLNLGLVYMMQQKVYDAYLVYNNFLRRNPSKDTYRGGINDLREVIRDNPGRYPFAYLFVGMLSLKQGNYGLARDSLNRFSTMPFVGKFWREIADKKLREMDISTLPR
ncbi:MAG: tetratricopeptide repeat protein [bacterium]